MKQRVYIETTIVSYLTGRLSKEVILLAQQKLTREWWKDHRQRYDLYTSQFVVDEASDGNPEEARKRLDVLKGLMELPGTAEALALAERIVAAGLMPERAGTDALHLAMVTVNDLDVLLTWNCRHLANADILLQIGRFLRRNGYEPPLVVTPYELMGGSAELRG